MSGIKSIRKAEQGFTLVELAIVMIIIGLLIGGILKGQELIANARVAATVTQIKGIDSATSTFQDKYNALPGDMLTPTTRLANCAAAPCNTPGNGDGQVKDGANVTFAQAPATETLNFFVHLAAADLISGVNPNLGAGWGGDYPTAQIGGGMHVGYLAGAVLPYSALGMAAAQIRAGHYIAIHNTPAGAVAATGVMTPNQAYRIDAKLDDGAPVSGSVFPAGAPACINGNVYQETVDSNNCNLYIRFHQ